MNKLQQLLKNIDGKGYKAYKSIQGSYSFHRYEISVDYVQGDPFASPSKIRIIIPNAYRQMKEEWKEHKQRNIYVADHIARSVAEAISKASIHSKGSGKSGLIHIDKPGQEILERTAVQIKDDKTVICLSIGLPANGRKINGKQAETLFLTTIPSILRNSIFAVTDEALEKSAQLADQHAAIRQKMKDNNWIAFIQDGAILPRQSGISNKPLKQAVPFNSPEKNRVAFSIPHREEQLTGMAVKKGISLIVGGGYHGKSTLLEALERGVYHHIAGDGREYVLTDPAAVKIRAEDGRQVTSVNISAFINDLPHGQDTKRFTTENASGSTSQATNVVEAMEAGTSTLLIDEDTSATNFMIRDARMQALVHQNKEPITPFIDKIKQLYDQLGLSTILVMGGSGDYFEVADDVIMMDQYQPINVTEQAKKIVADYPVSRKKRIEELDDNMNNRVFLPNSLALQKGKKKKVQAKGRSTIMMGQTTILLQDVEQLVDDSQTRTIAELLRHMDAKGMLKQDKSLARLLDDIEALLDNKGLQALSPFPEHHPGDLARPRRFEMAACLNRMRTAKIK
ncbi:ABC-ATPase domain-containing protein [Gracilibacillus caseinilyticus]|uniref:ABC-ATPase domain-containing protein n=1 Tax=Gracilibacillus caseinilyticus TaxID=2932256 RepID=A0ABY4EX02_9BACI|nr:ABC-ATPase domain-containing protein [Gracilibacillus caseinilyticus]UOQ48485.1 ABC-ATPase domain-containing protein [Gracilibacillus caseinilyticus]